MKLRVGLFVLVICLTIILHSCRRNQPTLVDANRPPDTELWYSPPDSVEYDYLVHIYWRGIDRDGTASRFIWTIQDSIVPPPLGWDPSNRIRDLQEGRFTSRRDSIFSFTAFRNVGGVGLRKNRQAFYIAAIDDNGVIDPSPAVVEFIATVDQLPEIKFTTYITSICNGIQNTVVKTFNPAELDTVGMFRPFNISYSGSTVNGELEAYKFFPLTADVILDGADVWSEDLSDTLRNFPNAGPDALPSGRFRFAAQVRDGAGAESRVDAGTFTEGVCQVVVNFEPDTDIFAMLNTYQLNGQTFVDSVDFEDSEPDTMPYNSWVTLFYNGWDNPCDSSLCIDVTNKCLRYQVQYTRTANLDGGPENGGRITNSTVRWLPENGEDNNPFGTPDSTSMTVGSEDYEIRVRTVDEYAKPDGTPDWVNISASFTPTIDSHGLVNYDGNAVPDGDTLWWDWFSPANFQGSTLDTLDFSDPFNPEIVKEFFFVIEADGHDHPKEPNGIGSWLYVFRRVQTGTLERLKRSGFWTDGLTQDAFADTVRLVRRYPFGDPVAASESFATLPSWLNVDYDFTIRGRDAALADKYDQFMFVDGEALKLNTLNTASLARWTGNRAQRVYIGMRR